MPFGDPFIEAMRMRHQRRRPIPAPGTPMRVLAVDLPFLYLALMNADGVETGPLMLDLREQAVVGLDEGAPGVAAHDPIPVEASTCLEGPHCDDRRLVEPIVIVTDRETGTAETSMEITNGVAVIALAQWEPGSGHGSRGYRSRFTRRLQHARRLRRKRETAGPSRAGCGRSIGRGDRSKRATTRYALRGTRRCRRARPAWAWLRPHASPAPRSGTGSASESTSPRIDGRCRQPRRR